MNVSVQRRINGDKSVTYSARYTNAEGKEVRRKMFKTEPSPTKLSLRKWDRQAAVRADELARELEEGPRHSRPPIIRRTLTQGLAEFLDWCAAPGPSRQANRAPGTAENIKRHVEDFIAFVEVSDGREYDTHGKPWTMDRVLLYHIAHWRDNLVRRGLSPASANTRLASLGAWFSWALDHGHVYRNEVQRVKRFEVKRERAKVPIRTPSDLRRLLDQMPDDTAKHVVGLLATTGMRQGTLKNLPRSAWNRKISTLSFPDGRQTTKRTPTSIVLCSLASDCANALQDESDGPYLVGVDRGAKKYTSQINAWLRPTGITPHDLRRFFVTAWETMGAPETVIDDYVGHAPKKTRGAYTPEDNERLQTQWVEKFSKWLRGE